MLAIRISIGVFGDQPFVECSRTPRSNSLFGNQCEETESRSPNVKSREYRLKFEAAKQKEISSWLDTATVSKIARNRIPPECILRSRWILTWKDGATNSHLSNSSAQGNSQRVPKARLVVLGYEDPELHNVQRDSPTLTKSGRSLILQYAANMKWEIASFDIKTAFLRGTASKDRVLGLEPVPEFQERLQMQKTEILQLLKGAHGRADAPFLWFQELRRALLELKFVQSPNGTLCFHASRPKRSKSWHDWSACRQSPDGEAARTFQEISLRQPKSQRLRLHRPTHFPDRSWRNPCRPESICKRN